MRRPSLSHLQLKKLHCPQEMLTKPTAARCCPRTPDSRHNGTHARTHGFVTRAPRTAALRRASPLSQALGRLRHAQGAERTTCRFGSRGDGLWGSVRHSNHASAPGDCLLVSLSDPHAAGSNPADPSKHSSERQQPRPLQYMGALSPCQATWAAAWWRCSGLAGPFSWLLHARGRAGGRADGY